MVGSYEPTEPNVFRCASTNAVFITMVPWIGTFKISPYTLPDCFDVESKSFTNPFFVLTAVVVVVVVINSRTVVLQLVQQSLQDVGPTCHNQIRSTSCSPYM